MIVLLCTYFNKIMWLGVVIVIIPGYIVVNKKI